MSHSYRHSVDFEDRIGTPAEGEEGVASFRIGSGKTMVGADPLLACYETPT